MIELVQFPWSPFCIVQRRILEYSRTRFKITNIPNSDRTLVWKLTKQRYHNVPVVRDGKAVVFETSEDSQVIAKYLDERLGTELFPPAWRGIQFILWRYIENEIEGLAFKLNDIYFEEFVPARDHLGFIRHKERKFGRGCIDQWRREKDELLEELSERLVPFEQRLLHTPFLLDNQPRFVDFDLYGMLANFLYSGHYRLPERHTQLQRWYKVMSTVKLPPQKKRLP